MADIIKKIPVINGPGQEKPGKIEPEVYSYPVNSIIREGTSGYDRSARLYTGIGALKRI